MFYNFIIYNNDFNNKYHDLSNINNDIKLYNKLSLILTKKHKYLHNEYKIKNIIFYLNDLIISDNIINLRNIFDILHINDFSILKIILNKSNVIFRKKHKYDDIKEYKSRTEINVLTVYIKNKYNINTPIFLKININGDISIEISINDEFNISLNDIKLYLQNELNPLFEYLDKNKFIFNVYSKINVLTNYNLYNLKNKLYIKHKIEDVRFNNINNINLLINEFSKYTNIFSKINKDENDIITFKIFSGVSSFNVNHFNDFFPNINNYFIIYSSLNVMNQWRDKYPGNNITLLYNMNFFFVFGRKFF